MADIKFRRDLNSLIRHPVRKRLRTPALRSPIDGGVGIAEEGDDIVPINEGVYVRHYGGGITNNDVYFYDAYGAAPVNISNAGVRGGLGVVDGDIYACSASNGSIYKNGSSIKTNSYSGGPWFAAGSSDLIVEEANSGYFAYLHTLAGVYTSTTNLPYSFESSTILSANDEVIAYIDAGAGPERMRLADRSGTSLMTPHDYANTFFINSVACNKSASVFADAPWDGSENIITLHVFNNAGTLIGEHALAAGSVAALGGHLSVLGMSENRIYLVGASASQQKVLIYDHTLTINGAGLATNSTIGSLLYTVNTPQSSSNWTYKDGYQEACMDSIRFA